MGQRAQAPCALCVLPNRIYIHGSIRNVAVGASALAVDGAHRRGSRPRLVSDLESRGRSRTGYLRGHDWSASSRQRIGGCFWQYGRDCYRPMRGGRLVLSSRAACPSGCPVSCHQPPGQATGCWPGLALFSIGGRSLPQARAANSSRNGCTESARSPVGLAHRAALDCGAAL
jgi:hypothetical protein